MLSFISFSFCLITYSCLSFFFLTKSNWITVWIQYSPDEQDAHEQLETFSSIGEGSRWWDQDQASRQLWRMQLKQCERQRWRADGRKGSQCHQLMQHVLTGRYEGIHSTQSRGASLFVVVARNEARSSEFVNVSGKDNRHESSQKLRCLVIRWDCGRLVVFLLSQIRGRRWGRGGYGEWEGEDHSGASNSHNHGRSCRAHR